jgi:hypothetical protein
MSEKENFLNKINLFHVGIGLFVVRIIYDKLQMLDQWFGQYEWLHSIINIDSMEVLVGNSGRQLRSV